MFTDHFYTVLIDPYVEFLKLLHRNTGSRL
jgi:hypothetical protein